MKNKTNLTIATLGALLILGSSAAAQDAPETNQAKNFATHKAEALIFINKEKSILEQMNSCVNAAQKIEDMKKCHDSKRSEMQKLQAEMQQKRQQRLTERRKNLTDKLNKLEAEEAAPADKK